MTSSVTWIARHQRAATCSAGTPVRILSDDELADPAQPPAVASFFQQFHLAAQHLSAWTTLMFCDGSTRLPARQRESGVQEALRARGGLGHRLENKPNELSGGQHQRVGDAPGRSIQPACLAASDEKNRLAPLIPTPPRKVLAIFDETA